MTKTPLMNNPLKDIVRAQNAYRVITKIYDHWRLSDDERAHMLGIEVDAYRAITKSAALPATEEMLLRVSDTVAVFRILSTIYYFDHQTVGRIWMKRKNWRAPFYGERPIEYIRTGYPALESTRRHLEALAMRYGGVAVGRESTAIGNAMMGEILAFNNFAFLQHEDADICAIMLMRICDVWKLSSADVIRIAQCDMSKMRDVAALRSFPDETLLAHWRMLLTIYFGFLVQHHGNEDVVYKCLSIPDIALKNGMTPLHLLQHGEHRVLYKHLKQFVEHMP